MKSTLIITLGILFAAANARTSPSLKSLLQTADSAEDLTIGSPLDYGFPANCTFTFPPGNNTPGNPPPVVTVCQCPLVVNGTGAGLPGLGSV